MFQEESTILRENVPYRFNYIGVTKEKNNILISKVTEITA